MFKTYEKVTTFSCFFFLRSTKINPTPFHQKTTERTSTALQRSDRSLRPIDASVSPGRDAVVVGYRDRTNGLCCEKGRAKSLTKTRFGRQVARARGGRAAVEGAGGGDGGGTTRGEGEGSRRAARARAPLADGRAALRRSAPRPRGPCRDPVDGDTVVCPEPPSHTVTRRRRPRFPARAFNRQSETTGEGSGPAGRENASFLGRRAGAPPVSTAERAG